MTDYRFFDAIQEVVLVIDHEGRAIFGNTAAAFLFDLPVRRLSSKKPLSQSVTFEPNPIPEDLLSLKEVSQMREVVFTTSGGKTGSVQVIVQPQPEFFSSEPEEKNRFVVTIRDVSLEMTLQKKYRGELDQKEAVIADLVNARAKLEDYSKNLEKMVADRTAEITKTNALLRTILDSLGQGILVFGADGKTLPIYSKVCQTLFGQDLEGRAIESVLGFNDVDTSTFATWRQTVFAELLDFSDLTPLAPSRLPLDPPKEVALSYNRMVNETGSTAGVVVVTTDRTAEVAALKAAQQERALVRKIVQVAKHRDAFRMFVDDAQLLIAQFLKGEIEEQATLERRLHTLKGGAATFALDSLAACCHHLEDGIRSLNPGELFSASFKMRLIRSANEMKTLLDGELQTLTELLGPITAPRAFLRISEALGVYSQSMVDLAEKLGKKLAPLEIEGGDIEVPTVQFQGLLNSFVHAFRNAIDHGLEPVESRVKAGKSEAGHLKVSCLVSGGKLQIAIKDDGGGINLERVREKLRSTPARAQLADGADFDVAQAILEGDLSTADVVTDISGRGVGLSAVTEEVRRMGGKIHVVSELGKGMTIKLEVPLAANAARKAA